MGRFHRLVTDADVQNIQTFPRREYSHGHALFAYYVESILEQALRRRTPYATLARLADTIWSAQEKEQQEWWQLAEKSNEAFRRAGWAIEDFVDQYDRDLDHLYELPQKALATKDEVMSGQRSSNGYVNEQNVSLDDAGDPGDAEMFGAEPELAMIGLEEDERTDEDLECSTEAGESGQLQ